MCVSIHVVCVAARQIKVGKEGAEREGRAAAPLRGLGDLVSPVDRVAAAVFAFVGQGPALLSRSTATW